MSYGYQPPQPHQAGYPPHGAYPPQGAYPPPGWQQPPPQHFQGPPPPHAGPAFGYAPPQQFPQQPPPHPQVLVDVHQQYGHPVQQGNAINQPLFSPSQMAMSSASPSHQLGGSAQAKMEGASALAGLRDKWWLLLFVLHLLMLFVVEGVFGKQLMDDWNRGTRSSSLNLSDDGANVVGMLVVSAVIGAVFSAFWFKCLQWAQGKVVIVSVAGNIISSLGIAILYSTMGLSYFMAPFVVWSVWLVVWVIWNRNRIPLAEATIATAAKSVSEHWGPILVAYGMALVQVGWHLNASFTIIAVSYVRWWQPSNTCSYYGPNNQYCSYNNGDGGSAWSGFSFWYTIVSFYWTSQVVRNVAHFTTAGTVSSWWLISAIEKPTWGAFKRASTSSLGTVAVGSLFVAIIEIFQLLARYAGTCLCSCLCGWVKRAMQWFNRYAFIISAMYGKTYFESAKHVQSLMGAKFWELLVNDTLTSSVFWMGNWLGGMVAAIVGGLWARFSLDAGQDGGFVTFLLSALCFFIGFNISSLFMAVLDSAVSTTLVVWAEDPQSMHRNRPEQHDLIAAAAQKAYPTEFAVVFVPVRPAQQYMPGDAGLPYHQQQPANFNPHAPPQY